MTQEIPASACKSYLDLSNEISKALVRAEAHAKATHERFNVFSTLLKESDEVRLHTRFLHVMLDPEGTHDCGSLFLELFFKTLMDLKAVTHDERLQDVDIPFDGRKWTVKKEVSLGEYGQIDLLLESAGFNIAIENKIHAGEGEDQLSKYGAYLNGNHVQGSCLIYLTLDGKLGHTAKGFPYLRISYKQHILEWLDLCLRETYNIIPVNQIIIQYRAVVRRLTSPNPENEFMKNVFEMIRGNPDIIRYHGILSSSINTVRAEVLDDFAERLMKEIKAFAEGAKLNPQHKESFGQDSYASLWIAPHATSDLRVLPFSIWFENNNGKILLGMKVPDGVSKLDTDMQGLLNEMGRLMNIDAERPESYEPNPNEAWPTGWETPISSLNDDVIANWMSPGELEREVNRVSKAIENHISLLERAFLAAVKKYPSLAPDVAGP